MDQQQAVSLLTSYRTGTATPIEKAIVEAWLDELIQTGELVWEQGEKEQLAHVLETRLMKAIEEPYAASPVIELKPRHKRLVAGNWIKYAAAAIFIGLISFAGWEMLRDRKVNTPVAATRPVLAPDKNRAMITLGDGSTVYLDQQANGELANLDGLKLVKTADGKIVYEGNATSTTPRPNRVSNPKGSRVIDLGLPDGTHIWLNAGSSITYNVPFHERNIQIEGEAYFEVAKDAQHPFTVSQGETKVQVLGTHFNVKAYREDANIKVTLLEGSVRLRTSKAEQLLKPGEQAIIAEHLSNIQLVKDADTEEALAWKNGFTSFHGAQFQAVLNEIQRWYDIEIEMKAGNVSYDDISFYVSVRRDAPLSNVLESVLTNNKVRYTLDQQNKKLIILP